VTGQSFAVQDTILGALVKPAERRIWVHVGCGGWVLFRIEGGFCLSCEAGPLHVGEYEKPREPS